MQVDDCLYEVPYRGGRAVVLTIPPLESLAGALHYNAAGFDLSIQFQRRRRCARTTAGGTRGERQADRPANMATRLQQGSLVA